MPAGEERESGVSHCADGRLQEPAANSFFSVLVRLFPRSHKFAKMSIFIIPVETFSQSATLASLIVFLILYIVYLTVYRLFLSPISRFPGPKLAAWTFWYEFWYDVVAEPEYTFKIGRLHKEYGMWRSRPEFEELH